MALYYSRLGTSVFPNSDIDYDLTLNIRLPRQWRENWFRQAFEFDGAICSTRLHGRRNLSRRSSNCDQQSRYSGDVCHVSTLPESSS
jgi:hypothetical protein